MRESWYEAAYVTTWPPTTLNVSPMSARSSAALWANANGRKDRYQNQQTPSMKAIVLGHLNQRLFLGVAGQRWLIRDGFLEASLELPHPPTLALLEHRPDTLPLLLRYSGHNFVDVHPVT